MNTHGTSGPALAGRIALVTGGAGGLGAVLCRALAARGATVIACDVDEEGLQRVAAVNIVEQSSSDESNDETSGGIHALRMNLADAQDIQRGVQTVLREHGGVDILIHAAVRHFAGDDGHEGRAFVHHSPQQVMETLAVNVTGPTLLAQLLCQGMIERRWGRIVLVGSMHRSGTPGLVMYAAGKAFLNTLARGLFLELREHNIVAAVANPGGMNTRLHGFRYPWMLDPAVVAETIVNLLTLPDGVAALSFEMVPHDPEHPDAF